MSNEEKIIEKMRSVYIENGIEITFIKHPFDEVVIEFNDYAGGNLYRSRTLIDREECKGMPENIYEDFLMAAIENGVKIVAKHRKDMMDETYNSHIFLPL